MSNKFNLSPQKLNLPPSSPDDDTTRRALNVVEEEITENQLHELYINCSPPPFHRLVGKASYADVIAF